MLQQTQVRRVLEKYPEFLKTFPSFRALANAGQREVVVSWKGMGYNNRAVRLHRLAQIVVSRHRGRLPNEPSALRSLPGIGPYTADAIRAAAFGESVPAVDVNVRRVLSRIFWAMRSTAGLRSNAEIEHLATTVLPKSNALNQALMDLGSTVCTSRRASCEACPVSTLCRSARVMKTEEKPMRIEQTMNGIPRRIHRGKIVDELRRQRKYITSAELGRRLFHRHAQREQKWMHTLLHGLERDGLIRLIPSRKGHRVMLA